MDKKLEKLTFSPNGRYLVTVMEDGEEVLWKLRTPFDVVDLSFRVEGAELEEVMKKLIGVT